MSNVISQVLKVELYWLKCKQPIFIILAIGKTSSGGWTNGELAEYVYGNITPPSDGIQSFAFIAVPPVDQSTQVLSQITAIHSNYRVPEWLQGIKVIASKNDYTVSFDRDTIKEIDCNRLQLTGILKKGATVGCWSLWQDDKQTYSLVGRIKYDAEDQLVYLTGFRTNDMTFCNDGHPVILVDWMSTNEPKFI